MLTVSSRYAAYFISSSDISVWENVKKDLKNKIKDSHFLEKLVTEKSSLQAMENIPWDFMDRTYNVAVDLLKQGNFQDAECVFLFLRFLCPAVFEYWVGEATALQMQGQWEEAMNTYFVSLVFKPKNPLVFFQIATCCQKLELQDKFKNALDLCIEYAKSDVASRPIADLAKEMRKQVA